ncbi:hypothetical protein FQN55_007540 [Onygenales sp. PD_40]|nr:hypothetical protein FQN55_007540 [Onygenales sp. PD_40]KAK2767896.1 hypothetical protein FQN53_006436 [Emmonsiellopsis sp. PD_33]KAK2794948.1 hypothetical protein FQN52_006827 [Onygenales sp. PD_12]KAK2797590.1 hypothetical protein FQN51_008385 [Onygenales sp. PD_10]
MLRFKVLLFAFLLAAIALAAPTASESELQSGEEDLNFLFARDKDYACRESTDKAKKNNKGKLVENLSKDKAVAAAKKSGLKAGKSGYPQRFSNKGGLKFAKPCNKKGHDIYEFPIKKSGNYPKEEKGANPGRFRVYYDQYYNFCGIGMKANKDNSGNPHLCT